MTENVLEEALRAYTTPIAPDPISRAIIAGRLTEPAAVRLRLPLLAAAAAVVGVVVAVTVLFSGSSRTAVRPPLGSAPPSTLTAVGPLATVPLDPRTDVPAWTRDKGSSEASLVYVRATTGTIVAHVPTPVGDDPTYSTYSPVLSADGQRIFVTWSGGRALGYLDVRTGKRTLLVTRPGQIVGVTASADGSTLAYEWVPTADGDLSQAAVVVRDLATGSEKILGHAPAGPQILPLALSPDGATVAVVATDAFPRRLLLVPFDGGFARARTVSDAGCSSGTGNADEPRWTALGLFVVQHCGDGQVSSSDIGRVDPTTAQATLVQRLTPVAHTLLMTVVQTKSGTPLFVTADESLPDSVQVLVRDLNPDNVRILPGLTHLAVGGAE
jgi:hypothetical protein